MLLQPWWLLQAVFCTPKVLESTYISMLVYFWCFLGPAYPRPFQGWSLVNGYALLLIYNDSCCWSMIMSFYRCSNSSSVSVWLVWYLTDLCFFATGGVVGGGQLLNSSTITLHCFPDFIRFFSITSTEPFNCSLPGLLSHLSRRSHKFWGFCYCKMVIFLLSRK